jgi:hypothetical protein
MIHHMGSEALDFRHFFPSRNAANGGGNHFRDPTFLNLYALFLGSHHFERPAADRHRRAELGSAPRM